MRTQISIATLILSMVSINVLPTGAATPVATPPKAISIKAQSPILSSSKVLTVTVATPSTVGDDEMYTTTITVKNNARNAVKVKLHIAINSPGWDSDPNFTIDLYGSRGEERFENLDLQKLSTAIDFEVNNTTPLKRKDTMTWVIKMYAGNEIGAYMIFSCSTYVAQWGYIPTPVGKPIIKLTQLQLP